MSYTPSYDRPPGGTGLQGLASWPRRAADWLDERGRAAWIAAMVLGFIFVWPVGLAILAYMIWSKRMFGCRMSHDRSHRPHAHARHGGGWQRMSGNTAFDAYRAETLRRLEEEQDAFDAFLRRLREAKDKSEFDAFMDDRARSAAQSAAQSAPRAPEDEAPQRG